jgi:hypothetical protein
VCTHVAQKVIYRCVEYVADTPAIQTIHTTGSVIRLRVATRLDNRYGAEWCPDLARGNGSNLIHGVTGTVGTATVTDSAPFGQVRRFYRIVREIPP